MEEQQLRLNCRHQGQRHTPGQVKEHKHAGHTPFFSCKHREDRPRPLTGCFTSSPIQDVSVLCTEPANETLRTADSDSGLLISLQVQDEYIQQK